MKTGIRKSWWKWRRRGARGDLSFFRSLFERFRELLSFNNRVLELIADMGDKLSGDYVFDIQYLEGTASELDDLVYRIIYSLNTITENRHLALYDAFERIRNNIHAEFTPQRIPSRKELIVPLSEADRDSADLVGGKMGTLGEIGLRLRKRIPDGFVITTNAYRKFVNQREIAETLARAYEELDAGTNPALVSERVRLSMREARIPEYIEKAIKRAAKSLQEQGHSYFAVRSSAIGEDGELSFAGQYSSFLQVPIAQLTQHYKEVISSLFRPEAIAYRRQHGLEHQEAAMAVGILAMVKARASGVMYTHDPEAADQDSILISAAWGLARTVVEGRGGGDL